MKGRPRKLSDEQALEVQRLHRQGVVYRVLAARFGVSVSVIQSAVKGRGGYPSPRASSDASGVVAVGSRVRILPNPVWPTLAGREAEVVAVTIPDPAGSTWGARKHGRGGGNPVVAIRGRRFLLRPEHLSIIGGANQP